MICSFILYICHVRGFDILAHWTIESYYNDFNSTPLLILFPFQHFLCYTICEMLFSIIIPDTKSRYLEI